MQDFSEKDTKIGNGGVSGEPAGAREEKGVSTRIIAVSIALSLVFGAIGGGGTVAYLLKNPELLKGFNLKSGTVSLQNQTVQVTEASPVTDVVKQASPAVVSVVITRDLSKLPGYGANPYNDFFNQFFDIPNQQQNQEPNVQQVGAGSGFFVSEDGLILTNKHVVSDEQAGYTVITNDGKSYEAKVLTTDPRNDLALMKIDIKGAHKLDLANSDNLQLGQTVVAIGNSLGQYANTVTTGVVSGIGRSITAGGQDGSESLEGVIQTDAAINPGNSGGPLLNLAGQVIGINTAIDRQGQLVGFAIPSSDAQRALASYEKNGKIVRPFMGVRYLGITPAIAKEQKLPKDYGALIIRGQQQTDFAVVPGSPADKAGLRENDIILEIDGTKIDENNTVTRIMLQKEVGDTLNLKIYSKGEEKMVKVVLEESK